LHYRFWLATLALVLTLGGCTMRGAAPQGLILYQQIDPGGENDKPEIIVADPQGRELRRIPLADIEFGTAATWQHRALFRTSADAFYLVDAEQGTAQKLALPDGQAASVGLADFLIGGGKRWTLLGDPQRSQAYLVDLESGQVTDLSMLEAPQSGVAFFVAAQFSPDDRYLLLARADDLWLIPTSDPSSARQVVVGLANSLGSFSDDGHQFA
jgi:hypothetical protein